MATKTRTIETAVGDARVEAELDKKGVRWTYLEKVGTGKFDLEKSLGNNARYQAIDKARVETYAEAMRRGDRFPPVIAHKVNSLFVIADGNHRLQSAHTVGAPLNVYDITGAPTNTIVMISFEANVKHGMPTNEAERISQALWLISSGANIPAAAGMVNLPVRIVKRASERATADQRFFDNSIASRVIEKLAPAVKSRLSQISTDEGFAAMVDLADRASIGANDLMSLVTEINEIRSSDGQVKYVRGPLSEQFQDQIADSGGGVLGGSRKGMNPKSRMSMALGQINGLPTDLSSMTALFVGPEREETAKRLRAGARRLTELARALGE